MPPHIKFRPDRNSYYLIDGSLRKSLKTAKKGLAQHLLEEFIKGKYGIKPTPTVNDFFDSWIKKKIPPLFRPSQIRDYNQHFRTHILPRFKNYYLAEIGTGNLTDFRIELLKKGLSVKTARNIIDSSFRAMYRDARAEIEALKGRDPFIDIQWPPAQHKKPDPFTAEERDRILAYWRDNDFFYFPWVFTLFHTGMRPSEAAALTWTDIDLEAKTISITKSRYMGGDSPPKTSGSNRTIVVSEEVAILLGLLPSRELGLAYAFVNKFGEPLDAKKWSEHNWNAPLKELGIRHRKFYATRHTFITEAIKRGDNPLAVAQYCGTSLAMIQADYCGTLSLDRTVFAPHAGKLLKSLVAGPGFEPGTSRL